MDENMDNVIEVDFESKAVEVEVEVEVEATGVVKSLDQELTVELLDSLVGKIVHVTTNEHMAAANPAEELRPVNVWFAGTVAGYERAVIKYNYQEDMFLEDAVITYNLLLTDGVGYILSNTACEIVLLSQEEFLKMVEEHQSKQEVASNILLPGVDF